MNRDETMARMYRSGATLQAIGNRYGVTRQRVQQIISKRGITEVDGGFHMRAEANKIARAVKANARHIAKHGCTLAQYHEILKLGREIMATGVHRNRTPSGAFITQRQNARNRKIPWKLKFFEWWQIWQASGKFEQRGRGRGYCLTRFENKGAFEIGNVYISTSAAVASNQYLWRPHQWSAAARQAT